MKYGIQLESIIYTIGLIIALAFIFFNIDDLIWDIIYFTRYKKRNSETQRLPLEKLNSIPPKLLAVIIAAWHEETILEAVIDHFINTTHYPQSMYHIFLGVYPNDKATLDVAKKLEEKYPNVHVVINKLNGPTSKAQNLNNIVSFIREYEDQHNWRFNAVTVHDSEDVVHPYELKVTNFLIDRYPSLQFPVFPLQKMPTWSNFFSGMTSGTYADEFAENHFRIMRMRDHMSAIVPSAGTGFAISHEILDYYKDEILFPEDSLTEDYKFSIKLALDRYPVHYVLESVPRLLDNGMVKWDYIATRSLFPTTFKTAVKQKTRWVYGITMQSLTLQDIFKLSKKQLNFWGRYSLYRDLKAKFGYLLVLPGYLVFAYFIASLFTPLPVMYPWGTLSGWLCIILTALMVYRQILRAIAINNIYGFKSVVAACLAPPILPLRFVWGNIINLSATLAAWKQLILGTKSYKKQTKIKGSKTDHEFINKEALKRYYRNIGDVLLEKKYIDVRTLEKALAQARKEGKQIGEILLRNNIITEEQLMIALAALQHKVFVKNVPLFKSNAINDFDRQFLTQSLFYPLFKVDSGYVIAQTEYTPTEFLNNLTANGTNIYITLTTKANVLEAINTTTPNPNSIFDTVEDLLREKKITWEQAVLAVDYSNSVPNILEYMGIEAQKTYDKEITEAQSVSF